MATADVDVVTRPRGEAAPTVVTGRRRLRPARVVLNVFLIATALAWLTPLLWTLYTSLRPYQDTAVRGYVSLPGELNFDNFVNAWNQADLPRYYLNTLIIVVPAVILTLMFASFVAFVVSRFDVRINLALLMLFTAGNLLPPQVIITPLYRIYLKIPLPAGAGRPGDAGVHLDLQRLLLGAGADANRREAADRLRVVEPQGRLLRRQQPDRRRRPAGSAADADRLLRAPAPVRARPHPRRHQGLSP
jgi:hypothetical protein